eukprot:gnl/Dysnectes_brevis/6185_a9400_384.p1 GENE.gnl/Dysnectes_brevis/6185_a9400_384~~gnl/Dysnectes_brevis/6185_a9400_384.p1  ORF type:complete len:329 (-),score=64.62 gnl/Dysnectes_brevis/6185_a9400_384:841-1827(-)
MDPVFGDTSLDLYSDAVQSVVLFCSVYGSIFSFILCILSIISFKLIPSRKSDLMWPNRLIMYLNYIDMFHCVEPFLIWTRDKGWPIPCYLQFLAGNIFHQASVVFSGFLAIEIWRACHLGLIMLPTYEKLYLALGLGYPLLASFATLFVGIDWGCTPTATESCPHDYIGPDSYYGCHLWKELDGLRFIIFNFGVTVMIVLTLVSFVAISYHILKSQVPSSNVQRLSIMSISTLLLMGVPWIYNFLRHFFVDGYAPPWLIVYHSVGNGFNGAINVILYWWRTRIFKAYRHEREITRRKTARGSQPPGKQLEGGRDDMIEYPRINDAMCL